MRISPGDSCSALTRQEACTKSIFEHSALLIREERTSVSTEVADSYVHLENHPVGCVWKGGCKVAGKGGG